jgi:hypothetical protein
MAHFGVIVAISLLRFFDFTTLVVVVFRCCVTLCVSQPPVIRPQRFDDKSAHFFVFVAFHIADFAARAWKCHQPRRVHARAV